MLKSKSVSVAVIHELEQIIKWFDLLQLQASIQCLLVRFAVQLEWAGVLKAVLRH
jgi:hypothetical protein